MANKYYTPDGFTDQLPGVCAFKRELETRLRNLFMLNGYEEIETPGIEYLDVYKNFVAEENLYKFTDTKGRLLCTRFDGTIPAARFAAGSSEALPLRLSYIENMFRMGQVGGGKQAGFTQAGIELLGATGSASDAEVIAIAIKSALETGITDLQVSVGQIGFFAGLVRQMGLSEDDAAEVKDAIANMNSVIIENLDISDEDKKTLLMLTETSGTYDAIDSFMPRVTDEGAIKALENLKEILDILDGYGFLKYVTVDLGLMEDARYYTGVVFKGYTYEVGFPIIGGGRYDNISKTFGADLSAVGFSISLTLAITALMRQDKFTPVAGAQVIVGGDFAIAAATAETLRSEGTAAVLDTTGMTEDELNEYAEKKGIATVMYMNGGEA